MRPLVVVSVLALVAGAVAGVVAVRSSRAGATEPVAIVRWHERGESPFFEAMPTPNLGQLHQKVGEVARGAGPARPGPGGTATVAVRGTTPGLYGGSPRQICDVAQLKQLLADDAGRSTAFAGAVGEDQTALGPWLDGLSPVVLAADTFLTTHLFADGRTRALPAVLQAGTAVLVDRTGLPRVACSSGNPLTRPSASGMTLAATRVPAWEGYDADQVTSVEAGSPVDALELVDVSTGARVSRRVGAGAGWVALATEEDAAGNPRRSHVISSPDGVGWLDVFQADEPLTSVGYGDGRWLAAGTATLFTSIDRRSWQAVGPVPGPITDLAFGDGRWLAVGSRPGDDGRPVGVVSESRDGLNWTTAAELTDSRSGLLPSPAADSRSGQLPSPAADSRSGQLPSPAADPAGVSLAAVAFGGGRWVVVEAGGGPGAEIRLHSSETGRTWRRVSVPDNPGRTAGIAFGDRRWALIASVTVAGRARGEEPRRTGTSAISNDGLIWTTSPLYPGDVQLVGPVHTGSRWFAAGASASPSSSTPLLASDDSVSWVPAGVIPMAGPGGVLTDLAYGGGPTPVPDGGPASVATTITPPADGSATAAPAGRVTAARITGESVSRRAAPRRSATVTGTLARGREVQIECQVLGEAVGAGDGTPVWNRLVGGGYVSDAYMDTPKADPPAVDPAIGACPP